MNKKGQGISMNVIIIAAIALLVLVVLSVIFIGRMGIFKQDTDCPTNGGVCKSACTPGLEVQVSEVTCRNNQLCCKVTAETP